MSLPESGWVAVALLGKTRGNRGEVTALPLSDKPERYQALRQVYLEGAGAEPRPYTVEEAWFHQGALVFKFQGVDTISDAERLSGAEVRVPAAERVALDEGEYFQSDLVGCEIVECSSGRSLGHVTGWQEGGGSGLLVIDSHWLIPFARSICVEIDPAARRIAVELPAGLKDVNAG
ncbi:MAG TPA: ribosome maturation factor RimM [Bryobacteraceae bacterium]|nr:ribosome maturation factor RimM [Bryobacteraceae bacterium]